MNKIMLRMLCTFSLGVAIPGAIFAAPVAPVALAAPAKVVYQPMPKAGRKITLATGHYFTFGFEKQPKLGNAIMRVELFTPAGQRDRSFVLKGDADMPSMRGVHSAGNRTFAISAKGVYLMPVELVMPGDWEFRLIIEKDGKTLFRGAYLFDI